MVCLNNCSWPHGFCVTPENGTAFCECAPGWTGKTDFLYYDGYDCPLPTYAEQGVYVLLLFGLSILINYKVAKAYSLQKPRFEKIKSKQTKLKWHEFGPYRTIFGTALAFPFGLMWMLPKVLLLENRCLSQAWIPSIGFVGLTAISFSVNMNQEKETIKVMLKSSMKTRNKKPPKDLKTVAANVIYITLNIVILSIGCVVQGTDIVPNPETSMMRYLLVVRNIGLIIWAMATGLAAKASMETFKKVFADYNSGADSKSDSAVNRILNYLKMKTKTMMHTAVLATVLYTLASIPVLWQYNTFFILVTALKMIFGKTHPINNLTGDDKKTSKVSEATTTTSTSSAAAVESEV